MIASVAEHKILGYPSTLRRAVEKHCKHCIYCNNLLSMAVDNIKNDPDLMIIG